MATDEEIRAAERAVIDAAVKHYMLGLRSGVGVDEDYRMAEGKIRIAVYELRALQGKHEWADELEMS